MKRKLTDAHASKILLKLEIKDDELSKFLKVLIFLASSIFEFESIAHIFLNEKLDIFEAKTHEGRGEKKCKNSNPS